MGRQREQTACRLRRLQEAIEGADRGATARMARRLGVSIQRWNNVTRGLPLGMDLTRRLVTRFPGVNDRLAVVRPNGRHERRDRQGTWARGCGRWPLGSREPHANARESAMTGFAKS
jgi:hypothetical protein